MSVKQTLNDFIRGNSENIKSYNVRVKNEILS